MVNDDLLYGILGHNIRKYDFQAYPVIEMVSRSVFFPLVKRSNGAKTY